MKDAPCEEFSSQDIIGLDVQWTQSQIQLADGAAPNANGTVAKLPGRNGWITLDPFVGARMVWLKDSSGLWRELRVGQWIAVSGNSVMVAGAIWEWTHHARLIWSAKPIHMPGLARPEWAGPPEIKAIDMLSQIASGIANGKPSAAGASVGVGLAQYRWSVLDGRAGVARAWVRVGGSSYDYFPVEHGQPFPIDGTAGYEVRVHPSEYGSKATFIHTMHPQSLPEMRLSVFEGTFAASASVFSNSLIWPGYSNNDGNTTTKLTFKSSAAGTYDGGYVVDAGDGTAPGSSTQSTAATTAAHQVLSMSDAGVPVHYMRLITFGGVIRAWCER